MLIVISILRDLFDIVHLFGVYWAHAIRKGFFFRQVKYFIWGRTKPQVFCDVDMNEICGDDSWCLRAVFSHAVRWNVKINFLDLRNSFTVGLLNAHDVLFVKFWSPPIILCAEVVTTHGYWKLPFLLDCSKNLRYSSDVYTLFILCITF
jgi:hypothetical protein